MTPWMTSSRAGIRSGDLIVSVDGHPVDTASLEDAIERMRGRPGTRIKLSVLRDGVEEPLYFMLTRASVPSGKRYCFSKIQFAIRAATSLSPCVTCSG